MKKLLSLEERKRHIVTIPKSYLDMFPKFAEKGATISVNVNRKTYNVDIDKWGRIRFGSSILNEIDIDEEGSIIIIQKKSDSTYIVSIVSQ